MMFVCIGKHKIEERALKGGGGGENRLTSEKPAMLHKFSIATKTF